MMTAWFALFLSIMIGRYRKENAHLEGAQISRHDSLSALTFSIDTELPTRRMLALDIPAMLRTDGAHPDDWSKGE